MSENNFIFWGTPEVAKETLEILKSNGYLPILIITSPDKPQGRKMLLTPPPVKTFAIENNIPYLQPEKLNEDFFNEISKFEFSLSVVVAYGKIIPERFINLPKIYSINIHYSLLPKYRGASPVESAILNGDETTGVSIQKMNFKMDTGPIITEKEISIEPTEKTKDLKKKLIKMGSELLIQTLSDIFEGRVIFKEQDETQASYCVKIKKEDGLLDPHKSEKDKYNKFKAYHVWPRTYFFEKGKRVIITEATLENNKFVIKKIIKEGGKEKDYIS